jgi:hypothetical protein
LSCRRLFYWIAMTRNHQEDGLSEADEAQYALECVLARLRPEELRRILEDLPERAREHIRLTAADFPGE